jgi:hypothetical protein
MDILAALQDKLRFIERFYRTASEPFLAKMRKIEAEEAPYESPPFDPDRDSNLEPPFQAEWEEAYDAINLMGQLSFCLVQSSFREYLDGFIRLSRHSFPGGKGTWFERYKSFFLEAYEIDWETAPVTPAALEEINLTRNDIQHPEGESGLERRMSRTHRSKFPDGIFADQVELTKYRPYDELRPHIFITEENLHEAVRRVESFCDFLEQRRAW